jgi:hypothetical protein
MKYLDRQDTGGRSFDGSRTRRCRQCETEAEHFIRTYIAWSKFLFRWTKLQCGGLAQASSSDRFLLIDAHPIFASRRYCFTLQGYGVLIQLLRQVTRRTAHIRLSQSARSASCAAGRIRQIVLHQCDDPTMIAGNQFWMVASGLPCRLRLRLL